MFCTRRIRLIRPRMEHLDALVRVKADKGTFARMLGGARDAARVMREFRDEDAYWEKHGLGMCLACLKGEADGGLTDLIGLAGFHDRPDLRGRALRFAVLPHQRRRGLGVEMVRAALGLARARRDRTGWRSVVAAVRADNAPSHKALVRAGMIEDPSRAFIRDGLRVRVYEYRLDAKADGQEDVS